MQPQQVGRRDRGDSPGVLGMRWPLGAANPQIQPVGCSVVHSGGGVFRPTVALSARTVGHCLPDTKARTSAWARLASTRVGRGGVHSRLSGEPTPNDTAVEVIV